MSYTEYVTREVTGPLGFDGIQVCPPESRAVGYAGDCEHAAGEGEFELPLASAAAGFGHHWCASVLDLVRLARALFDRSLLQERSVALMTTPVELSNGRSTGHGYALAIESIEGRRVYSHTGGSGGFRVRTAHYVEPELTIAVLANCHGAPVEQIEREVAAAVLGWPPRMMVEVPLEARDLDRYVGTYQLATTRVRITAVEGRLRFEGSEPAFSLLYQGRHTFASVADKNVLVKFEIEDGRSVSFVLTRGGFESTARRME
jgi:CubicO group peptidase (beta-lactamase class C family)